MNIFEFFHFVGSNVWLYGGAFLVVLSILVFVHEWGHYIIARLCGIRVETFSIGFGKELFGWSDTHGTRWKFSLIPLGGYVKMFGDTDPASASHEDAIKDENGKVRAMTAKERSEAFFAKSVWKRAAVVVAGPAINYIFAIILLCGLFVFSGKPMTPPVAGAVIGGSSAEKAGFQPGDLVLSIDGDVIEDFDDIRRDMMIGLNEEKHFKIKRGEEVLELIASPELVQEKDHFGFSNSRGVLGLMSPQSAIPLDVIRKIDGRDYNGKENPDAVRKALLSKMGNRAEIEISVSGSGEDEEHRIYIVNLNAAYNENLGTEENLIEKDLLFVFSTAEIFFVKYSPQEAIGKALQETWSITVGTLEAIGQIITGTRSTKELGGIVRIGAMAGDMAQQGFVALVMFTALLSINLGLINLFPIPLLDGGHLVFYAFEAAIGKPIPEKVQDYAFRAGFVFLIGVMVFANLNDILQLVL